MPNLENTPIASRERENSASLQPACRLSQILFINSYHRGYSWSDGIEEGLHRIGQAIDQPVRHTPDLAVRYGGEEFSIILPETTFHEVKVLAECIRTQIEQLQIPHTCSETADYVTVSLGVVTVEAGVVYTMEEVVQLADKQLYKAKMVGRNLVLAKNLGCGDMVS